MPDVGETVSQFSDLYSRRMDLDIFEREYSRRMAMAERGSRRTPSNPMDELPKALPRVTTPLDGFRWLCGAASREIVDDSRAELRRDARSMWKENRSRAFIARVIWFRSCKVMIEVALDGVQSMLKRTLPFLRFLGF